jgi:hypothetical protein
MENTSKKELCEIVYDTLMKNTMHEQLDMDQIENQTCYASDTEPSIRFTWRRKDFEILISEVEAD